MQLIDRDVKILIPAKQNMLYDAAKVVERYGVEPKQIPELLALMGDNSDNIPGVPGVGEKTAIKLLNEFGSLERIAAGHPEGF